jgi:hypothetical protein
LDTLGSGERHERELLLVVGSGERRVLRRSDEPSQYAAFQQTPSSSDFPGLPWAEWCNGGASGNLFSMPPTEYIPPGNYTLVFWNYGSVMGYLQFQGPLYLAYNLV